MTIAPTLFDAAHPAPRVTDRLPVAPRPLECGDHASVISLMSVKGWTSGEVVSLQGPDGKGREPRAILRLFRTGERRGFPLSDLTRHAKPDELVEDFYAEREPVIVIPCGGKKATEPCAAGLMYLGAQHTLARQAADRLAFNNSGRVLILSAKHGLLDLDTVIDPYDMRLDHPDAVTRETVRRQLMRMEARRIIALTPKAYTDLLLHPSFRVEDRLAGTTGIFDQRHVLAGIKHGQRVA